MRDYEGVSTAPNGKLYMSASAWIRINCKKKTYAMNGVRYWDSSKASGSVIYATPEQWEMEKTIGQGTLLKKLENNLC